MPYISINGQANKIFQENVLTCSAVSLWLCKPCCVHTWTGWKVLRNFCTSDSNNAVWLAVVQWSMYDFERQSTWNDNALRRAELMAIYIYQSSFKDRLQQDSEVLLLLLLLLLSSFSGDRRITVIVSKLWSCSEWPCFTSKIHSNGTNMCKHKNTLLDSS